MDDSLWQVHTADHVYEARAVAICNGAMSTPRVPAIAGTISPRVEQLHSVDYHAPDQISTDNVLVVGSGSSGVQICRLLAESGQGQIAAPRGERRVGPASARFGRTDAPLSALLPHVRLAHRYHARQDDVFESGVRATRSPDLGRRTSNEIMASNSTGG